MARGWPHAGATRRIRAVTLSKGLSRGMVLLRPLNNDSSHRQSLRSASARSSSHLGSRRYIGTLPVSERARNVYDICSLIFGWASKQRNGWPLRKAVACKYSVEARVRRYQRPWLHTSRKLAGNCDGQVWTSFRRRRTRGSFTLSGYESGR